MAKKPSKRKAKKIIEKAKAEGRTQQHCVGSLCFDNTGNLIVEVEREGCDTSFLDKLAEGTGGTVIRVKPPKKKSKKDDE